MIQRGLDHREGQLMRDAGISSVRFWLPWAEVESRPGLYDWSMPDEAIREIAAQGLTPLPYIFGTPAWAAKLDGHPCDGGECSSYAPASVATRLAFARAARVAVRRYGPGGVFWDDHPALPYRPITAWQLWNEPNLQPYYRPSIDPARYAELVRAAAAEIHAEDAGAQVLLAGLSGSRTNSQRVSTQEFLTDFYAVPGIEQSFEGLALHPYHRNKRGVFDQLATAHLIATVQDPGVDLWITELGWASAGDRRWAQVKGLDGQAKMLRRVFGRLIRHAADWDLRGAYWYAWRDTERTKAVCGWCGAAGLRDAMGVPKPAYYELQRLTR